MPKTTIEDLSNNPDRFVDHTVVITRDGQVHHSRDDSEAYRSAEGSGSETVAQDHNIVNSDSVHYLIQRSKGE